MEIEVEDFEKEFEKSLKHIKAFSKITNNSNEVFMKIKSELFVLKTRLATNGGNANENTYTAFDNII